MTAAQGPGFDPGTPIGDIEDDDRLDVGEINLLAVHVNLDDRVEILASSFQYIFGAVRKVDQFVDDSAGDEVEWTFPGLVEVVGDQGVDADAQVVLHKHFPW